MIFRNFNNKGSRLRRDALASLPAKLIPSVLGSNLAKQAGDFGLVSTRLTTLIFTVNLRVFMTILNSQELENHTDGSDKATSTYVAHGGVCRAIFAELLDAGKTAGHVVFTDIARFADL